MNGSVVAYAVMLGMVALINPCGFPLLPAYLSLFIGVTRTSWLGRVGAGLRAGAGVTCGFVAVFALAGAVTGVLHELIMAVAPWLMIVIGLLILAYGVLAVAGRAPGVHLNGTFRQGRGFAAMAGFGAAYAVGSLSCALPVFVAAVGGALATGSTVTVVAAVAGYGIGMGLLATVLALLASLVGGTLSHRARQAAAWAPRVIGAVCALVGAYTSAYWIGQLGGPNLLGPVVDAVDRVQAAAASLLQAAPGATAVTLATMAVLTVLTVAWTAAFRRRAQPAASAPVTAPAPSANGEHE